MPPTQIRSVAAVCGLPEDDFSGARALICSSRTPWGSAVPFVFLCLTSDIFLKMAERGSRDFSQWSLAPKMRLFAVLRRKDDFDPA